VMLPFSSPEMMLVMNLEPKKPVSDHLLGDL